MYIYIYTTKFGEFFTCVTDDHAESPTMWEWLQQGGPVPDRIGTSPL